MQHSSHIMAIATGERRQKVTSYLLALQSAICEGLEQEDGVAQFSRDEWQHNAGGGGISRVIQNGGIFEKGGVNFSAVTGELPVFLREKVNKGATTFFATGVSIVLHPRSPLVPIIHMNVRYFETDKGDGWFGGGIDLTPIYVRSSQAKYFHECMKAACDVVDAAYYERFKVWADDYFYNKHRQETRGVGGIFYDYLRPDQDHSFEALFALMQSVGNTFLTSYLPIVQANKTLPYSDAHKQWQLIRRGRYVEFNLVYDRGTRFGLETGGRIESILMSLPALAAWEYNHLPAEGSDEAATLSALRKGVDWLNASA